MYVLVSSYSVKPNTNTRPGFQFGNKRWKVVLVRVATTVFVTRWDWTWKDKIIWVYQVIFQSDIPIFINIYQYRIKINFNRNYTILKLNVLEPPYPHSSFSGLDFCMHFSILVRSKCGKDPRFGAFYVGALHCIVATLQVKPALLSVKIKEVKTLTQFER